MKFIETDLKGVYLIEYKIFEDERGFFIKTFHSENFNDKKLEILFKETFYSISKKNVIRGMHFQNPPSDHAKLVSIVKGKILDIVLDLRKESETYGKFEVFKLSDKKKNSIYIPSGCAHGFASMEDDTIVFYMMSSVYSPENDSGIRWDSFGFDWEIKNPIVSKRDRSFVNFRDFKSLF